MEKRIATQNITTPTQALPVISAVGDVFEHKNGWNISLLMPGVDESDLRVEVESNVLTIEGSRRAVSPSDTSMKPILTALHGVQYRRQFQLSDDIDSQHIEAQLKDGVLSVKLPRAAQAKARKISVVAH